MDDKKLDTLQAEDQLAITNPEAFFASNPTPRDWNLTPQEIAKSIKVDPYNWVPKNVREGPDKLNMVETTWKGFQEGFTDNPIKENETSRRMFSSPNMTEAEANRLMQDVMYTDYIRRQAKRANTAEEIKYNDLYEFSNSLGYTIRLALIGAGSGMIGGPVAAIGVPSAIAGAEAAAQMEMDLRDRYVDKYGTAAGYTKADMWKDSGIASAYGLFIAATEGMFGIEPVIAGTANRFLRISAASRLARMQGKLYKSAALKAGRAIAIGGGGEAFEELIQNPGEAGLVALAGYADQLSLDEETKKTLKAIGFAAITGGAGGWIGYRVNRQKLFGRLEKWNKDNNIGLTEQQIVQMGDQMIDDSKTQMLDEIATRVEIRNKYGEAYDLVKQRLMDQINATGTVPWQDKAKTKEEYVQMLADTITIPAINVANQLGIKLHDFLEIADVESWVIGNIAGFKPITSVADIDAIIDKQNAIIKDQREKKKLGIDDPDVLDRAKQRKAIAERVRREVVADQEIAKRRSTARKATADYITAKELQPTSVASLENATTAQEGEDYTLFAGKKIPVQYEVVELASIQPSHINGTANPNYTNEQLQNRASRGTVQDVADLREKASIESFTPERLMKSPTSAEGAPVVNAQGDVIAGNGRTEIVRYAYENPETAEKYKQSLVNEGFSIDGMSQPILIRRNTTLTPDEQIAAADLSNISETSAFDEASQARRDSKYLADSKDPTEFASKLPMSERRGLMQNNGKWNKRRVQQRYESALLSWLCGNDTQLFERLVLDRGIGQKVIDILTANGNMIYETATKYPDLNIREDIYHALVKMQGATRDNFLELTQQLSLDGHDVMPENIFVWNWLFADSTTNRQFMDYYLNTLAQNQEQVQEGEDLLGQKKAPLSKKDALIQALKKADQAKAEMAASRGKEYEPLFNEDGTTNDPILLSAIASYKNQFAPTEQLNQRAFISGTTFYNKPSTKYVLKGGEGAIVHGWGIYTLLDQAKNASRYRRGQFAGRFVFLRGGMPKVLKKSKKFDNTIFAESGAEIIDFRNKNKSEGRAMLVISSLYNYMSRDYQTVLDDIIKEMPKTYAPFAGLYVFASKAPYAEPHDLFYDIAIGKYTLSNITESADYESMVKRAKDISTNAFFASIIDSARKIYDDPQFKEDMDGAFDDAMTWAALAQAFKEMTKDQKQTLKSVLETIYELDDANAELMIEIMQAPENLKKTRGQQLEVEVPEDEVLLDEDDYLNKQKSAPIIRQILEDFISMPGLTDSVTEKPFKNIYRGKHQIPYETLREWHAHIFENYDTIDQKEIDLFLDYLMDNMKGDTLVSILSDQIPEGYWMLKNGEEIGDVKADAYDERGHKTYNVMGIYMNAELARDISMLLNDYGIQGIKYHGGIDGDGVVVFSDEAIQTMQRLDDEKPIYYQGRKAQPRGTYDPELQTIILGKNWNELTLVHEFHHRYLELMWGYFKQAQAGSRIVSDEWLQDMQKLFQMLEIDPDQEQMTVVQQEKFAYMVEAYLTGLGVDNTDNLAFQGFLHWVPEQYRSIMDLGYLDENNIIQNPMLDEEAIAWFNKWFASPFAPSLPSAPDAQRMVNPTDETGQIVPSNQKIMNNREKEWGQDSEEQLKADAQLYRAIGENQPTDMRAALDGEEELMKAEAKNLPDDTKLPETPKQTFRERWFKARETNARERAADMARKYVAENPEKARELAFADPETMTVYDAPVDQGMLIRAVMETVPHGSEEWYILNDNLAMVKSMSGSTLALSGDLSHQAYLNAKREVEAARELKAAVNYAGTSRGAMEKWDNDIKAFIAQRTEAILATEPGSTERKVAIKAMLEEAKTKFSANATNAILNQLDLTGMRTKNTQVFIKWAEKQIKQATHAKLDTKEQQELMKASIAAQLGLRDIDSTEVKDGKYVRAVQSGKDIRHWQYVKDKMKKAYIGRWGKFGIFMDNLFGSYAPSAMLMSVNTLFFANVPSTAINTVTTRLAVKEIGKNNVDSDVLKGEIKRIKQVFNATGMNLAQMDKPTSPSMLHGEKYTNQEQSHWYNFTFEILGRTDNEFRVPTFVDALARIATKNANGDKARATALFKEYCRLNTTSEEAQIARKQALAVANMAVFTQDGIMAGALNHIRSALNTMSRGALGLQPEGFGLGNILAPFLKTGANITEMGLAATLAPIRTAIAGLQKLQGKEIPDIKKIALISDWINLAWMSVVIAVLAAINSDDDEWYIEPYQTGKQYDPDRPYDSVNFGGVWVKLDIFGPLAIPLRAALKMVNDWEKKKLDAVASGLFFGGMEALSDTPLVQQFTDSSLDYMTKQPGAYWSGFGYNQLNKFIPAQAKTLSRAITRGTGTVWQPEWMGKTIGRKFHRNYGLDGERLTTNDLINILTNRLKYNPQ